MNRIVGIALLAAGVALLYFGYKESESFASGFSRAFTGSPTDRSMSMLIGGGVLGVVGLGLTLRGDKKKKP